MTGGEFEQMNGAAIKPAVSVVLPTYNRAHTLDRAVGSVLGQTFGDLELIIVDDGSTDDTGAVVSGFNDPRIRYVRHDVNRGANVARNTGIKLSRGEYLAFQDSDDEWLPEKLARQVNLLTAADKTVGVVYTGCLRRKAGDAVYIPGARVAVREGDLHRQLLTGNFIAMPAVLIRRCCLVECGLFDEGMPRLQDWDLWIRVARRYLFACVDEPLVMAYHSPGGISDNAAAYGEALGRILEKYQEDYNMYPPIKSRLLRLYAFIKISGGDAAAARKCLGQSFWARPNVKSLLLWLAALFGGRAYLALWGARLKARGLRRL